MEASTVGTKILVQHSDLAVEIVYSQPGDYILHGRLCVCLSVSCCIPTLLHRPRCNLGNGRGCPLVVHYWVDLQ